MKNLSMVSAVILSASCLTLSVPSLAYTNATTKPALVVDPITGVVEGTTTIVSGVSNDAFGVVTGVGNGAGGFLTNGWNTMGKNEGQMYRGINNQTTYRITETGVQSPGFSHMNKGTHYVITNMDNGKRYRVLHLKTGTMDVMNGNKVTRYQYVQPVVRAL